MSVDTNDSTPVDVTPVILDALKRAADAHGVHEATELGGVRDEQWPEWYAAHMAKTLEEAGFLLVRKS
jgi:hypothetical protein